MGDPGEECGDEAQEGGLVGEDAGDAGPALEFLVHPFDGVGGAKTLLMSEREGPFDSLYFVGDPVTAPAEVNSEVLLPGGPISIPSPPGTLLTVQGVVSRVLDLNHADPLTTLGTTAEEMTAPWIVVATPPAQVLAQAAHDCGRVAGIRHGSAKHRSRKNLMGFTDRLQSAPADFFEVHDPDGHLTQRIGANRCA